MPIDYLEFGVHKGDSIVRWAELNRNPESRFFGFDSFEGLPEDYNPSYRRGTFDTGSAEPRINDPRVSFVKGWFQRTLPGFVDGFTPRSRLVVHNDSDLYSSTLFVLTEMDRFLVPGTIIIFDEFSSPLHEFRAFHDYLSAYMRESKALAICGFATQAAFQMM
jgi:O-methyltransferase